MNLNLIEVRRNVNDLVRAGHIKEHIPSVGSEVRSKVSFNIYNKTWIFVAEITREIIF
jgi:hypothetical protein